MTTSADSRIAAIAALQHSAFSLAQTVEAGMSRSMRRRRITSGRWDVLAARVFAMAGSADTWRRRAMAATLEAGHGAVLSHRAAAALLGLPGFPEGPVEITVVEDGNRVAQLARVHESALLPANHRTVVDGIPCTTLARCIFDLARREHPLRVRRALSNGLSRGGLTVGQVEQVVASIGKRGRGGTALMRELLDELEPDYVPTDSELEDLLLAVLIAAGVELPRRQVWVGGATPTGRVDFLYVAARLVIECQSRTFHSTWLEQQADMVRRAELAAAGYRVLEVTWRQLVDDPEGVVRRITAALAAVAVA